MQSLEMSSDAEILPLPSCTWVSTSGWYGLRVSPTTGELGYDGPLYDGFLHMTDDMLGPSSMHIKYSSYVYDGFCI